MLKLRERAFRWTCYRDDACEGKHGCSHHGAKDASAVTGAFFNDKTCSCDY